MELDVWECEAVLELEEDILVLECDEYIFNNITQCSTRTKGKVISCSTTCRDANHNKSSLPHTVTHTSAYRHANREKKANFFPR